MIIISAPATVQVLLGSRIVGHSLGPGTNPPAKLPGGGAGRLTEFFATEWQQKQAHSKLIENRAGGAYTSTVHSLVL
jgi:hypothetical protein